MHKRIFAVLTSIVMTIILFPVTTMAEDTALGINRTSVTAGATYTISSQDELSCLAKLVNDNNNTCSGVTFILTNDITITNDYDISSDGNWLPIAHTSSFAFEGIFDGDGHIINNLNVYSSNYGGLFGHNKGKVQNVGVSGSIIAGDYVGGIVGFNEDNGLVQNCFNNATIQGVNYIGGVVGWNYGVVLNCYNTGAVNGNDSVGGLCGYIISCVINCYNTGTVTGNSKIGGLIGRSNDGWIENCFNTGIVSGSSSAGGLIGDYTFPINVDVYNCFWLDSSSVNSIGVGVIPNNIRSFNSQGILSSSIFGCTTLVEAMNYWTINSLNKSIIMTPWKTGSVYPTFLAKPVINAASLTAGNLGVPYSEKITAAGDAPFNWSIASGSLPSGLMLSSDGTINGTPTQTGAFNFTVTTENAAGFDTMEFNLVIKQNQLPLLITGLPTTLTYGDAAFTVSTIGGNGSGSIAFSINNQTDLAGAAMSGVAEIVSNNNGTATVSILKSGKFQISAKKAGDDLYAESNPVTTEVIVINKKPVTISGIAAKDKTYDGKTTAEITGLATATITGNIDGGNLTIDSTHATASFTDKSAGSNKTVTFEGFALSGSSASNYILSAQPANVTANINKMSDRQAPAAPTVQSKTADSITLTPVNGAEYSKDGTTWQDSNVFTGLSINTEYTFSVRYKETDIYYKSPESTETTIATNKLDQTSPAAPTVQSKTADSITLTPVNGAEYSKDGTTWQDSNVFTGLSPNTEYTFSVRYKETDIYYKSPESTGTTIATNKLDQIAPAAPTVQSKTADSITITPVDGVEYSKDGTTWQDSNVFTGLSINTEYTFSVRYKETDKKYLSSAVQIVVKTESASTVNNPKMGDNTFKLYAMITVIFLCFLLLFNFAFKKFDKTN